MWNLATGIFILGIVTAAYMRRAVLARRALTSRKLPSGHPWSGLALTAVGLSMFLGGFRLPPSPFQPFIHIAAALIAILWLIDDVRGRRLNRRRN